MSALADMVDGLGASVTTLPTRAQALLFAAAAEVLSRRRSEWLEGAVSVPRGDTFDRALAAVKRVALGQRESASVELIEEVEAAAFDELSNEGPTVVQDCWICLDSALRGLVLGESMARSTWYLLEPIFQDAAIRIYGVTDVGSDNEAAESAILDDARVVAGVKAIGSCIESLAINTLDETLLERAKSILEAIVP